MANNKKYKKIEIKSREKFASNFQSESARKKVLNKSGLHGKQNRSTKKQGDNNIFGACRLTGSKMPLN